MEPYYTIVDGTQSLEEIRHYLAIRHKVFREELGIYLDDNDVTVGAINVGMHVCDQLVGTARMFLADGVMRVGFVAVLPEYRKVGFGKLLMEKIKLIAEEKGHNRMRFRARQPVVPFYQRLGAVCLGDEFEFDGRILQEMEWQF